MSPDSHPKAPQGLGGGLSSTSVRDRLQDDLDQISSGATHTLDDAARRAGLRTELVRALPWLALVPLLHIGLQLLRWMTGGEPRLMSPWVALALGAAVTALWAWLTAGERPLASVGRRVAIGAVDRQLGLQERLVAADEFLGRRAPTGFERAAIEDAADRSSAARGALLALADTPITWRGRAASVMAAGLVFTLLSMWVATLTPRAARARGDAVDTLTAAGAPLDEVARANPETQPEAPLEVAPAAAPETRERPRGAEARRAESTPDLSDSLKESAGKTGAGRSSGAQSSSAASDSQSAPSSKGQESESPQEQPKPGSKTPRKPKPPKDAPPPPEERDEESGATAGKGSSKGSNQNPTASDWQSKDQVTDTDEQDVEADEEVDDDEEEQENRGGVQPSLRDRRPPVSRDLQIGFGNRPNPDANGRGGPSEQKKSRGVASLVLGVPVPDRVKGRPGPGPTKVTQERIEPEAEEAAPRPAATGASRARPVDGLGAPDLDPGLRALVRDYFLGRRNLPSS